MREIEIIITKEDFKKKLGIKDGKTPKPGVDFRIPEDGKDAEPVDIEAVVKEVLKRIKTVKTLVTEETILIKKIVEVVKKSISYEDIKDAPEFRMRMAGTGYFREITDVAIKEPEHGDVPTFNKATNKWENKALISSDNFAENETPTGDVNGVNQDFVLAHTPKANSLKFFLNGQRQAEGTDFTLNGLTITLIVAPMTGSILCADYRY